MVSACRWLASHAFVCVWLTAGASSIRRPQPHCVSHRGVAIEVRKLLCFHLSVKAFQPTRILLLITSGPSISAVDLISTEIAFSASVATLRVRLTPSLQPRIPTRGSHDRGGQTCNMARDIRRPRPTPQLTSPGPRTVSLCLRDRAVKEHPAILGLSAPESASYSCEQRSTNRHCLPSRSCKMRLTERNDHGWATDRPTNESGLTAALQYIVRGSLGSSDHISGKF